MAGRSDSPHVAVHDLTKSFGETVAVNRINLWVGKGEFVTLLGPSGCGKTTTLRCVAGLAPSDGGTIELDGRLVQGDGVDVPTRLRGLGMVFQSFAVWPHMTVAQNVAYPLLRRKVRKPALTERVASTLELVGLSEYGDRYPGQLSGGQQQRVALARAIVPEPDIVLYDEPLSNLDARLRAQMRQEIRRLHQRLGIAAMYVTHDQEEAMELSDRLYVMNEGRVIQSGRPQEVYDRPADLFVCNFLGTANVFEIARRLAPSGVGVAVETVEGETLVVGEEEAGRPGGHLVVRPHLVHIVTDEIGGTELNRLSGKVAEAVNLGSRVQYLFRSNAGAELVVDSPETRNRLAPGDKASVVIHPDSCLVV